MMVNSSIRNPNPALRGWLPDMDLNHDKQIQSLLCYRYTIGQTSVSKVEFPAKESRTVKTISTKNLRQSSQPSKISGFVTNPDF